MTSILGLDIESFKSKIDKIDSVSILSSIIVDMWSKESKNGVNYACKPYLQAMLYNSYGYDSKKSVILYALSNMASFRGGKAKILKNRLKEIVNKM